MVDDPPAESPLESSFGQFRSVRSAELSLVESSPMSRCSGWDWVSDVESWPRASRRPEDLTKSMERIEAEAARMGVLVEDLLLLARLDQGLPLARERVDLATLVARAVQDARAADPGRRIDLRGDGRCSWRGTSSD